MSLGLSQVDKLAGEKFPYIYYSYLWEISHGYQIFGCDFKFTNNFKQQDWWTPNLLWHARIILTFWLTILERKIPIVTNRFCNFFQQLELGTRQPKFFEFFPTTFLGLVKPERDCRKLRTSVVIRIQNQSRNNPERAYLRPSFNSYYSL